MAKLTTQEILDQFKTCNVRIGEVYQHYKGGIYLVTGITMDTDTTGLRISYVRTGGGGYDDEAEKSIVFSRRLEEWTPDRFAISEG